MSFAGSVHVKGDGTVVITNRDGVTRFAEGSSAQELVAAIGSSFDASQGPESSSATAAAVAFLTEAKSVRPHLGSSAEPVAHPISGNRVRLGRLARDLPSRPLADVLASRRSSRHFSGSIRLAEVAALLVRVHRVQLACVADGGWLRTWRPVPSAGGRHPIELRVSVAEVDGLDRGAWVFDPVRCDLLRDESSDPASDQAVARAHGVIARDRDSVAAATVWTVAHFARTVSRYPTGASLVWRDAGVVLETLHLTASDLGLASCIVGTTGLLVDSPGPICDLGCVLIGRA